MRGIHAFDVKRGVCLGIAQALRFFEHGGKVLPLVAHFAQDEISGAVDDARHPVDAVGRKPFAQRLDDGYAACHRSLKRHHHALLLRGGKNLGTVHRQQRLVGGDDVFAVGNGLEYQLFGYGIATNQLHHNIDISPRHSGKGIVNHLNVAADNAAGMFHGAISHQGNLNAAPGACLDFGLVALQDFEYTAAYGANP